MGYTPHVLVIGGGITGTAVARDLSIRGLEVTLVERDTVAAGATGLSTGLLSSGACGVADDSFSTRALAETEALRTIAPGCIEHTGSLLVAPDDGVDELVSTVERRQLPHELLERTSLDQQAPELRAEVERAISLPEPAVEPFALTLSTAASAREYGATIRTHTTVTEIGVDGGTVDTVTVEHDPSPGSASEDDSGDDEPRTDGGPGGPSGRSRGPAHTPGGMDTTPTAPGLAERFSQQTAVSTETLDPDYVVNAAGAWTGAVAALAGIDLDLSLDAQATLLISETPTQTIVACGGDEPVTIVPRGDGALVSVPTGEVADPGESAVAQTVLDSAIDRLRALLSGVEELRTARADLAVHARHPNAARTDHTLIDHGDVNGCWGMTTVLGGTMATHRHVASEVADHVCAKFGIRRNCKTAEIPLATEPEPEAGAKELDTGPTVCPCRSVSREAIRRAMEETDVPVDLAETRIRTGATAGRCQGGRCAYRIAAELYPEYDEETTEASLLTLLESRWEGQRNALGSGQLAQATRNYHHYRATMGLDRDRAELTDDDPDDSDALSVGAFYAGDEPERREPPPWGERPI